VSILVRFPFPAFLQQLYIFKLLHSSTSNQCLVSSPECKELCDSAWATKITQEREKDLV